MAQLERKLLDVEDSPDAHVKLTPDHQLGVANSLEPPKEQDGMTTTPSPTHALKNHESDVTNRLKQETNRLKQQKIEVQDAGYEEDYIVVDDEDSGLHYYNTEIVQDEVLKAFLGMDTFGTRDIFKKEHKETQVPHSTRADWTPSGSNLFPEDHGADCACGDGVTQFFDSIHALSIVAQGLEGETSLESTPVQAGPAKSIEKQDKNGAGTGLANSHRSTEPTADNANSETAPPGSFAASDKRTEKDDENIQMKDNAQESDHAPQQKSSDIPQGREENFRAQPSNDAEDFSSPIPNKRIVRTTPKEQTVENPLAQGQQENFRAQPSNDAEDFSSPIPNKRIVRTTPKEQTVESPLQVKDNAQEPDHAPQQKSSDIAQSYEENFRGQPANEAEGFSSPIPDKEIVRTTPKKKTIESPLQYKGSADTGLVYSQPSTEPNDLVTTMEPPRNDSSPVPEKEIVQTNLEVEQTIETPIEEDNEFAIIRESFYNVEAPDNMRTSDVGHQDESHGQDESGRSDSGKETIEIPIEEDPEFAIIRESFYDVEAPDNMQRSDVGQEDKSHGEDESGRSDFGKETIETPIEKDPEFATIRESFYDVEAPDNMQRSDVAQEDESHGSQGESGRWDSDKVRLGPRPDNALISEETLKPGEEKPNTVKGRRDEDAEIASRKQEEFEAQETEEHKFYDHQKSYSEKIYETASGAAHAVASKLGYGAAEGQSDETESANEGTDKGSKGIVERAGGVVASFLGIKHQEEDGQQSPHDMQEQEEEEKEETVERQFWDAKAEADNVETVEAQTQ